jgi:hypothetical protein
MKSIIVFAILSLGGVAAVAQPSLGIRAGVHALTTLDPADGGGDGLCLAGDVGKRWAKVSVTGVLGGSTYSIDYPADSLSHGPRDSKGRMLDLGVRVLFHADVGLYVGAELVARIIWDRSTYRDDYFDPTSEYVLSQRRRVWMDNLIFGYQFPRLGRVTPELELAWGHGPKWDFSHAGRVMLGARF